ncbi:MOSC domain-containing protein [Hydrogenophaga sp. OTU3427]|uniref:MOSC domain-containing protein n=1 Tax=Hydrogenophaga sp. OTU3427 TaxID=3043856 RepID=UPI00313C4B3A
MLLSLSPAWPAEADQPFHIAELWVYPVKSCAGVRVPRSTLLPTGLEWDRCWMVVDEAGEFVSQRELPRMALIQPAFQLGQLVLRAPGMLALHLQLDGAEAPCRVRVWDDELDAYDMGDVAAQWFSDFLASGRPTAPGRLRLVRFDPEVRRLSSLKWTGGVEAPNQFGDGFPLLLTSTAALDDLNQRLAVAGASAVDMRRFRPNIVLAGVEAHDEDRFSDLYLVGAGTALVHLQPVKPCARCSIPDVHPDTAATGGAVGQALRAYRADARLDGALTFGMNAIVRAGAESELHQGQAGAAAWAGWR